MQASNRKFPLFLLLFLLVCSTTSESCKEVSTKEVALQSSGYPDVDSLSRSIQRDSANAGFYAQRAALFAEHKQYQPAIYDMSIAMRIDSVNAGFHRQLSEIYLDISESRMALRTMDRAVKLFPKDVATLLQMGHVQLILKQYKEALESFHNALQIDPGNSRAFLMMGTTLLEMGETERAQKAFEKSSSLDSRQMDAWINLAQMRLAAHDPKAIDYVETALKLDSLSLPALHTKALYLSNFDQIPAAINIYRRILQIDRKYTDAALNGGILLFGLDSLEAAQGMFEIAIAEDPFKVQAYYYRGLVKENLGDLSGAKIDFKKATAMAPDYEKAITGIRRLEKVK